MRKTGIVGAGIAGIATAIRLAVKGYDVDVFEGNTYPGGKLTQFTNQGFRFDAGPSLFTLPTLVDELFQLAGKKPTAYFSYEKLEVNCHYFFEDGLSLKAYADVNDFAKEVNEKTGEDPENVKKALRKSAFLYETLSELFMFRSIHRLSTFINKKALRAYLRMPRLDFLRTLHQANQARFKDPRMVQFFNRFATYNGSNPYETPATLSIIPHLEFNIGAYLPKGSMHSITQSLYELACELGVTFHFSAPVSEITCEKGKVTGLISNDQAYAFDLVVSNMDVVNTYRKLLKDVKPPEKILNQPKSSSALIFYWGIKAEFLALDLHNIFFSDNYEEEFKCIFEKKVISEDPTVYINISSKYVPQDAPAGCENWFIMINTPNNTGQDWDKLIAEARQNIIKKISRMIGQDIEPLIVCEQILEPRTIESKTSSAQGALYGNSSNNRYAAFLRHANAASKVKGLYFCGGSVHPGGGIPLCLSSAKIAASLIIEAERSKVKGESSKKMTSSKLEG
ncbi:MAG: 1-hydroxycarotenoid 3,4-desaturase CrtD [Cyclobacteriaceae bacterium]